MWVERYSEGLGGGGRDGEKSLVDVEMGASMMGCKDVCRDGLEIEIYGQENPRLHGRGGLYPPSPTNNVGHPV